MRRPLYETSADLAREKKVADKLAELWQWDMRKLPISYKADYLATGQHPFRTNQSVGRAWVEVRCRNHTHDTYPSVFISVQKVSYVAELMRVTDLPFYFVVEWQDMVGVAELKPPFEVDWTGRNDMRDSADVEPIVHVPLSEFDMLWETEGQEDERQSEFD